VGRAAFSDDLTDVAELEIHFVDRGPDRFEGGHCIAFEFRDRPKTMRISLSWPLAMDRVDALDTASRVPEREVHVVASQFERRMNSGIDLEQRCWTVTTQVERDQFAAILGVEPILDHPMSRLVAQEMRRHHEQSLLARRVGHAMRFLSVSRERLLDKDVLAGPKCGKSWL